MSQQTSSQGSVCSGSTRAYAEPMHAMAYFLPAAFLYNPHVPKEPVSFFLQSGHRGGAWSESPWSSLQPYHPKNPQQQLIPHYNYLGKMPQGQSAGSAQGSSQFKERFQGPATQWNTGSHHITAGSSPSSFIFLEPSPGCLSQASAGFGHASQLHNLKGASLSEVQRPPCETG